MRQFLQLKFHQRVVHNGLVFGGGLPLVVGITPKQQQIAHGDAAVDAVFLGQNRQHFCHLGGGRAGKVAPVVADAA